DTAVLEVQREVAVLTRDGAGQLEAVALAAKRPFARSEGVARVHPRTAVVAEERAVVRLCAGLGIDLNAAAVERRLAVFGGEEVGIHLDIGDGVLRRHVRGVLKSIDGDGCVGWIAA